jgi:alkylhydroperoxidase family enzyme
MGPYLQRIEKPKGLLMKVVYFFTRKTFGKVPTPIAVTSARMPFAFLSFSWKASRLDKKLELREATAQVIRDWVARANSCLFCTDMQHWFVTKKNPANVARLDALPEYRTSPLFTEAERAALDYAGELTETKHVSPETFATLKRFYSEREICDIAWLVASEHLYNVMNHGLNIGSDGLCELRPASLTGARRQSA